MACVSSAPSLAEIQLPRGKNAYKSQPLDKHEKSRFTSTVTMINVASMTAIMHDELDTALADERRRAVAELVERDLRETEQASREFFARLEREQPKRRFAWFADYCI